MKTYEQLMKHYWGNIVPMAEADGIKPWECVRSTVSPNLRYTDHPKFDDPRDGAYTFALTVLDGKPVFVGDRYWLKHVQEWVHAELNDNISESSCSWTPPTKKRTFMLELTEEEIKLIESQFERIGMKICDVIAHKCSIAKRKE